jgi:hypothetical protein
VRSAASTFVSLALTETSDERFASREPRNGLRGRLAFIQDEHPPDLRRFVHALASRAWKDLGTRLKGLHEKWQLLAAIIVALGLSAILSWRDLLPRWTPYLVAALIVLWTLLVAAYELWVTEVNRASTAESEIRRREAGRLTFERRSESGMLLLAVSNQGERQIENLAAKVRAIAKRDHPTEEWSKAFVNGADYVVWDSGDRETVVHAGSQVELVVARTQDGMDSSPARLCCSRAGVNPYPQELPDFMQRGGNGWRMTSDGDLAVGTWRITVALEADQFRTQDVDLVFEVSSELTWCRDDTDARSA